MATSENTSTEDLNMSNQTEGGMGFGDPLAPAEGYEYDFSSDSETPQTPFDPLIGVGDIDDLGDIFGDLDPEDNPFGGNPTEGGGNPFGGGNSEGGMDDMDEDSEAPVDSDDDAPMPVEPDGGIGDGAGPIGNGNPFGGGNSEGGMGGGNPFGGGNIDTGEDNENLGSGNSAFGDGNSTNGNGNTDFGSNNQTEGNGNRSFGEDAEGFNEIFEGRENPLEADSDGSNLPIDLGEIGGNNPVFAGGGTPAPEGGAPVDLEDLEESSDNQTEGNGNWNFGSSNQTDGNGNWNFGSDSTIEGNGNWNLGDNNDITGSGNRPSGTDNTINGNGNQPTGSGNTISGNRVNISEDNLDIYGNGDRFFQTDSDGNITLVSDESASDLNFSYDFSGVEGSDSEETNTADIDFSRILDQFSTESDSIPVTETLSAEDELDIEPSSTEDMTEGSSESTPDMSTMDEQADAESDMGEDDSALEEQLRNSPFGRLLDIEGVDGAEDIFGNVGGGAGGGNSFGGGGVGNGNPFANWDPLTDGNPFIEGDEPSTGSGSSGSNPFGQEMNTEETMSPETDSITGEIVSIDDFVDSMEGSIDDFVDFATEDVDQPSVIAVIDEQYILQNGEGSGYISLDEVLGSDDLQIFSDNSMMDADLF